MRRAPWQQASWRQQTSLAGRWRLDPPERVVYSQLVEPFCAICNNERRQPNPTSFIRRIFHRLHCLHCYWFCPPAPFVLTHRFVSSSKYRVTLH